MGAAYDRGIYIDKRDCQAAKSFLWLSAVLRQNTGRLPSHCSGCDRYILYSVHGRGVVGSHKTWRLRVTSLMRYLM